MEDPRPAVPTGERPVLQRQEDPGRVDQVDDRNPAPHRHVLDSQDLVDRLGEPAPGLDRGVIRHHGDRPPANATDARDNSRCGSVASVRVMRDQQSKLEQPLAIVQECGHPLASEQLAGGPLALDATGTSSLPQTLLQLRELLEDAAHELAARFPFASARGDQALLRL